MKILQFETKIGIDNFITSCNANAGFVQGNVSQTLVGSSAHQTDSNIFWCYRDGLETHAASGNAANTTLIDDGITNTDFIEKDLTGQQLIDQGYLPEPE